ncbi:MAG: hypothetical protein CVV61_00560 [Tenericutes bacterium HGW-Tenericutes-6]|nr:MAG: hypothetical protein CVV61_00560 [Tenericutes bacterium HGW-Tenericutes-6]
MRKSILITGLLFVLLFVVMLSLSLSYAYPKNQDRDYAIAYHGMMRTRYGINSYESIYLHLSVDDQEAFNFMFSEKIKASDIKNQSLQDATDTINFIKESMIEDVKITYKGMGMMGSYDPYNSCASLSDGYIYEWYYLHKTSDEQANLDLLFAEKLLLLSIDDLSIDELTIEIKEIKEVLIESIISNNILD